MDANLVAQVRWMYFVDKLGGRITPKGADELPLAAIEVRKATKSTQTTKHSYQWRQQGLKRLEETIAVTGTRQTIGSLEEKCQWDIKTKKISSCRSQNRKTGG